MVENFYGLRWFKTPDNEEQYPLLCLKGGFVAGTSTRLSSYPDGGSKHHTNYWAKHKRIIPEELCVWT
jgi:hypothetical protein